MIVSHLNISNLIAVDIISAVEFDHSGDILATGDNGGRVVVFERIASRPSAQSFHPDERPLAPHQISPYEYRYLTEFQSHDAEFDYLKSLEIEEKINKIRWRRRWQGSNGMSMLTTNDKTVKLWKVYEKKLTCLSEFNLQNGSSTLNRLPTVGQPTRLGSPDKLAVQALAERPCAADILRVPKVISTETVLASKCRKVYSSAHTYHIHSISMSADEETFLSADDLRINLWHLERPDTSFNVVDIKPASMEDLTEVITAADFSQRDPHLFAYASSKGSIRLADLRAAALCDHHTKLFDDSEGSSNRTFFSEIIASVTEVQFVPPDGTHLITRDYMTMKLWDLRYEAAPVATYNIQESLRNKLCELYENDAIFDKFDLTCAGDGKHFATGTYSGFFRVLPRSGGVAAGEALLEASRDPMRRRLAPSAGKLPSRLVGFGRSAARAKSGGGSLASGAGSAAALASAEESLGNDLGGKISHISWNPKENVIATAAANSLYLFYGRDPKKNSEW